MEKTRTLDVTPISDTDYETISEQYLGKIRYNMWQKIADMTMGEAADLLRVSKSTIHSSIRCGGSDHDHPA